MEIGQIHSRESFLSLLDKEVKRARRYQNFFCILNLTLSELPNSNNGSGLQTCVQALIHFLGGELRKSDIIGFLAEHQLAVILPYIGVNSARHAQSRFKDGLKYYDFRKEGCEVKIDRICFPIDGLNTTDLIEKVMKK